MKLTVTSDLAKTSARALTAPDAVVKPAAARALTRAAVTVRKEASKEIRKTYAIRASTAKSKLRATRASVRNLESSVIAAGRRAALAAFGARLLTGRRRAGKISVLVVRRHGRRLVSGRSEFEGAPFIQTMPRTGHVGIYQRETGRRLKIVELFSIDVPTALVSARVSPKLLRIGEERFRTEFARELNFRSGRR